jgi:hypothetical protein
VIESFGVELHKTANLGVAERGDNRGLRFPKVEESKETKDRMNQSHITRVRRLLEFATSRCRPGVSLPQFAKHETGRRAHIEDERLNSIQCVFV